MPTKTSKSKKIDRALLPQQVEWRDYVGYSAKQRACADAAMSRKNARVLYGGAGFGGKSQLLRWVIFELNSILSKLCGEPVFGALACKIGEDLRKRHLLRLQSDYAGIGRICDSNRYGQMFLFNDTRLGGVHLIHLENPDRYRSAEFAYILGDEITEWTREDFGTLLYSLRSKHNLPFSPFIGASNPDGPGHSWVKKLWIERDFTGDDDQFNPDDFLYITALPTDNPTWTDDKIESAFAGLPKTVRDARLTGSWDVLADVRFPDFSRETHCFDFVERFPYGVPSDWDCFRAVDYGYAAPFCCLWAVRNPDTHDIYVYREMYEKRLYAHDQAKQILETTTESERVVRTYADPSMFGRHGGEYGLPNIDVARTYEDTGVALTRAYNKRVEGWVVLENYIRVGGGYPNLYIEKRCVNLIKQLMTISVDRSQSVLGSGSDIERDVEDHALDALRYLVASIAFQGKQTDNKLSLPGHDDPDEVKEHFMHESAKALAASVYAIETRKIRGLKN